MEGAELDLAVVGVIGASVQVGMRAGSRPMINFHNCTKPMVSRDGWHPSTNWSQGGPLIEKYNITLIGSEPEWGAEILNKDGEFSHGIGPTPLIAAMRALVKSKEKE